MALLPPLIKGLISLLRGGRGGGGGRKPPDYQGQLEREKAAAMARGGTYKYPTTNGVEPTIPPSPQSN